MLIKVCGMCDAVNIREVAALGINLMGFIFYPKSPRYFYSKEGNEAILRLLPLKKVGVFVDAPKSEIQAMAIRLNLDYLQLHGNESPEDCRALCRLGFSLIKAFSIASEADLDRTKDYEDYVDYFLFDTKCSTFGGSGRSFDWSLLSAYHCKTPFLLSGGIALSSVEAIYGFRHPAFAGVDLNSGFETAPGVKNVQQLREFVELIRNKQ